MNIFDLLETLDSGWSADWATTTLMNIVNTIQSTIYSGGMMLYEMMFGFIDKVMQIDTKLPNIGSIITFTSNVATSILIILFLKIVFTHYVLNVDGEDDVDPMQSLLNISFALALVNCGEELYHLLNQASSLLQHGLANAIVKGGMPDAMSFNEILIKALDMIAGIIFSFFSSLFGGGLIALPAALIAIIWMCVMIIMLVVLLGKMVFRSAELFIFRVLWPLFACDLISGDKSLWKPFFSMYMTTLFGFLLQYLCLMLSITLIYNCAADTTIDTDLLWNPILATAFLYFACKAPKWLQKFTYSSGVGQSLGSARYMMTSLPYMAGRFRK